MTTMMKKSVLHQSFDEELRNLQKAFLKELPEKTAPVFKALEILIRQLQVEEKASWSMLETLSHKIAGSSGTYGLNELSGFLRSIENYVVEKRFESASFNEQIRILRNWKTQLLHEIERLAR